MSRWTALLLVVGLVGTVAGCAAHNHPSPKAADPAKENAAAKDPYDCCGQAKAKDGWCEECKMGYFKGEAVMCKECHEAMKNNGWCKECKVGYANGKKMECKGCAKAATGGKPCKKHPQ